MQLHELRVVVFLSLCLVFGAIVWVVELNSTSTRVYLAASSEPQDFEGTEEPTSQPAQSSGAALTESNKQCPPPNEKAKYAPTRAKYPATYGGFDSSGKQIQILNLYGKPCYELTKTVYVQGICTSTDVCKAEKYIGQDGKLHNVTVPDGDGNLSGGEFLGRKNQLLEELQSARLSGNAALIQQAEQNLNSFQAQYNLTPIPDRSTQEIQYAFDNASGVVSDAPLPGYGVPPSNPSNPPPGSTGGSTAPGFPTSPGIPGTTPTPPPDSGTTQPPQNGSGTFTPTPGLSQPSWLRPRGSPVVINFTIGDFGGGGGSAGYAGSPIAYQYGPATYNNKNFDAADSQTTFAKPQVSPFDLIARLSANTPGRGTQITADSLADKSRSSVVKTVGDILSPVGDFFGGLFTFSSNSKGPSSSPSNRSRQPTLALDAGELVLSPGDPTLASWFSDKEGGVANPFYGSSPNAGDLIEEIANGPFGYDPNGTNTPPDSPESVSSDPLFSGDIGFGAGGAEGGEVSGPLPRA